MADVDVTKTYKISNDLEIAPIRSLDDFVLSSARFQIPQFNDAGKWSNRIVCNLLYYQTNYFIVLASMFLLFSLINPRDIIIGLVCISLALAIAFYFTSTHPTVSEIKRDRPYVSLGIIIVGAYACLQMASSLMVFVFSIAFPLLIVFIHASFRLRSMKNKIANKAEATGVTKTVMGRILDLLGMKVELVRLD